MLGCIDFNIDQASVWQGSSFFSPSDFSDDMEVFKPRRMFKQISCHFFETQGSGKKRIRKKKTHKKHVWVFPKIGGFPPKSSVLIRVFHYFHHPF